MCKVTSNNNTLNNCTLYTTTPGKSSEVLKVIL